MGRCCGFRECRRDQTPCAEHVLANNVELYFYSRDGQAYGPYTGKGPHGTGEFWTATIFGSEAILQIRGASNADVRGVSFRVAEAGLITPNFAGGLGSAPKARPAPGFPCGNPNCVVDASCVNTNLKLAVAKMEWVQGAFIYTCTGGLINGFNAVQNNFFLTANHCVSKNNSVGLAKTTLRGRVSNPPSSLRPSHIVLETTDKQRFIFGILYRMTRSL